MPKLDLGSDILLFTDGASKGNPGPGGYGAILVFPEGRVKELGEGFREVTNNQMELLATIEGIKEIEGIPGPLAVLTDSTYVIQGITQWVWGWLKNEWRTAAGKPVANRDYWQQLMKLTSARTESISWHYVRGHTGVPGNERADEIGSELAFGKSVALYDGMLTGYDLAIHDIPENTNLPDRSRSAAKTSKKAAYSYLSVVGGELQSHATWKDCEARVKGRSGARFKKAVSAADEAAIKKSWGF